ncbi:MAG: PP2C family protein-serine/threonine phosphatase [Planctomycetaceae bacterium]
MAADLTLAYASLSDVGLRRSNNQDSKAVLEPWNGEQYRRRGWLFLVADGMGAHAAGEMASDLAARHVPLAYEKAAPRSPALALRTSLEQANAEIHARGSNAIDLRGMGTTCTALVLVPRGALVGHVGDSRVYRVRGGRIDQLSRDHSLAWELESRRPGGGEEPVPKNIITRSMGPHAEVQVDIEGPLPVEADDVFVLCSDGLSGQVADDEIGMFADRLSPADATAALVGLALVRGAPDNVTVIVAKAGAKEVSRVSSADPAWPLTEVRVAPADRATLPWKPLAVAGVGLLGTLFAAGLLAPGGVGESLVPADGSEQDVARAIIVAAALAMALVFVGGIVMAILSSMAQAGGAAARFLAPGARLGNGPYRSYDCRPTASLLEGIVASVETAADGLSGDWRTQLLAATSAARASIRSRDFPAAIAAAAEAVGCYRRAVDAVRNDDTAHG